MRRVELALRLAGVGFFIGLSIVGGVALGYWLDNMLNTGPIMVIVGVVLGVTVAFYGVYRMLVPLLMNRNNKEK